MRSSKTPYNDYDAKIEATTIFITGRKRRIHELTQETTENKLVLETKEPDKTRTKKQRFSELTREANELDAKCTQLEEENRRTRIIATFMDQLCKENDALRQALQATREVAME